MIRLFDAYLKYLSEHPEMMSAIIIWSVATYFSWFALIWFRKDIIEGLKSMGMTPHFEGTEVLLLVMIILLPPILMYSVAFHYDLTGNMSIILAGGVIVGVFGRWGLEWIGNMWSRKGNPTVDPVPAKVVTTTTTETK